jgi:hypothetical protein
MVTKCKSCSQPPILRDKDTYCGNIGCIDYNKIVRRSYVKKEKACEEE